MSFTCDACGTSGSIEWMQSHPCQDVQDVRTFGGQCEDYPCCGHRAGECEPREEYTKDFYLRNPELLHEPGSPEWYDELDRQEAMSYAE